MTVETATYISDLNTSYPAGSDSKSEGDDHIRLIKSAVKSTFPNVTNQVTSSHTELNLLDGLTGTVLTSANFNASVPSGQWVLMNSTTVTAVAAIDFKDGTGGVTISDAYDEYLIVCDQVYGSSTTADLELSFSTDGGTTFPVGSYSVQLVRIASGTLTGFGITGASSVALDSGAVRTAATAVYATSAQVRIVRPVGGVDKVLGTSTYVFNAGENGGTNYFAGDNGSARFNALRLAWSTGSFEANGTIKLFARKV